jgi:hypothetical protein
MHSALLMNIIKKVPIIPVLSVFLHAHNALQHHHVYSAQLAILTR